MNLKNTNCLVTGGEGFIGGHIIDALVAKGANVWSVDDKSSSNGYKNSLVKEYYNFSILNTEKINEIFNKDKYDFVFHCAAKCRIARTLDNPKITCETNFIGTFNILEAAIKYNKPKIIYSSTSSIYGNNKIPFTEDMEPDCLNHYAVSKLAGEELCKVYYKLHGLKSVILRYFNVYGERQSDSDKYASAIGIFIKQKRNNEVVTIYGDGNKRRDFTHVEDVCEANIKAALFELHGEPQIFNIGSGVNFSINEILEILQIKAIYIKDRTGENDQTLADKSKTKKWLKLNIKSKLKKYLQKI